MNHIRNLEENVFVSLLRDFREALNVELHKRKLWEMFPPRVRKQSIFESRKIQNLDNEWKFANNILKGWELRRITPPVAACTFSQGFQGRSTKCDHLKSDSSWHTTHLWKKKAAVFVSIQIDQMLILLRSKWWWYKEQLDAALIQHHKSGEEDCCAQSKVPQQRHWGEELKKKTHTHTLTHKGQIIH